jgi:hypothetical protein
MLSGIAALWLVGTIVNDRKKALQNGTSWGAKIRSELKLESARPKQPAAKQSAWATLLFKLLTVLAIYCFFAVGLPS